MVQQAFCVWHEVHIGISGRGRRRTGYEGEAAKGGCMMVLARWQGIKTARGFPEKKKTLVLAGSILKYPVSSHLMGDTRLQQQQSKYILLCLLLLYCYRSLPHTTAAAGTRDVPIVNSNNDA